MMIWYKELDAFTYDLPLEFYFDTDFPIIYF